MTVTSPSAEVKMIYECFFRMYDVTSGTGRQHYLKIKDISGKEVYLQSTS